MQKYHMRRKDREIKSKAEIMNLLSQGKFIVLALCKNNEPYIVTLSYGFDKDKMAIYLHCAAEGLKLDFIRENPKVCASVIFDNGYILNECGHKYSTIVIRGQITIVKELEEKKNGIRIIMEQLEDNPKPIIDKNLTNDNVYNKITVLRLDIEECTGKSGR